MSKPKTLKIIVCGDEVEYIRKDSVEQNITYTWDGKESVATTMIGKKVIVRSRNEGVNAGICVLADDSGVVLLNCRRLHYHKPLNKNLSWYEGVAESGISNDSRVSGTLSQKVIIEDYSMSLCTDEAFKTIMEMTPNAQS